MSVGDNRFGGLGNGSSSTTVATTAVPVPGLTNIVDVKANKETNIALTASGDVYAWGYNGWLGLGTGGPGDGSDNAFTPQKITTLSNIVAISGCDDGIHFLALDANHNCYAWGFSAYGQLGSNGIVRVSPPIMVMTNVDDIMTGETFSYIVKTDGTLWASGASLYTFNFTPGSIWMNLPQGQRDVFTQIDPTIAPMNLCIPSIRFLAFANSSGCGTVTVTESGGTAPYTYNIGTGNQSGNIFTDWHRALIQ
jgi:hypothetical protein